jgi:hypothetical protein
MKIGAIAKLKLKEDAYNWGFIWWRPDTSYELRKFIQRHEYIGNIE